MKGTSFYLVALISTIGYNIVRGQDYYDFLREQRPRGHSRQRSLPPPPKISNNITLTQQFKVAKISNTAYTDDDFFGTMSNTPHVINCKGRTGQIHAMGRKAMCSPKPTLVKLNADPGYEYSPNIIILNRCKGPCGHGTQSCMLLDSTFQTIAVKRREKADISHVKPSECVEVQVEVHERCKCGCDVMESHCNQRQKYHPEACECKCNNLKDKSLCDMRSNMEWDPDTCRCTCKMEEEICNTRLVWVPSLCKCAQLMENLIE